ncbi:hypothetical protein FA13DRAFT_1507241 [Coprinellus micaceus]|uniref:Uncharacterized protein n=1 Tax=Coprinellus micaceus TaxID=71717 RepID=A0A4Y7SLA9_COPMI|nr:hypothetical protein FA13DRAFT_1507241 [Coprinellus micaceus]
MELAVPRSVQHWGSANITRLIVNAQGMDLTLPPVSGEGKPRRTGALMDTKWLSLPRNSDREAKLLLL